MGRAFPSRQRGALRELVSAACGMHGPDDVHPAGDSSDAQTSYRDTDLSLLSRRSSLKPFTGVFHSDLICSMANDEKSHGLYCQKCRTPLDIDASIDQLNPAAFKLLTGMGRQNSCELSANSRKTRLSPPNSQTRRPTLHASRVRHIRPPGTRPTKTPYSPQEILPSNGMCLLGEISITARIRPCPLSTYTCLSR